MIGGLASLLLSIPISLALFNYFARQHEEYEQYTPVLHKRLRSHRSIAVPDYLPHERDARYHDDEYVLVDGEISTIVDEHYQPPTAGSGWLDEEFGSPIPPARQLPPPRSSRHVTRNTSGRHLSAPLYGVQPQKTTPASRQTSDAEDEYRTRRTTPRRAAYPGLPTSQQASFRNRFRSEAMRTARLEATQQYIDESDVSFEDSIEPSTRSRRRGEPQTDHPLLDSFSEDVHRPLLRRAPYTYEDDEIRQEMSHYKDSSFVRRSSRYVRGRKDDDQAE